MIDTGEVNTTDCLILDWRDQIDAGRDGLEVGHTLRKRILDPLLSDAAGLKMLVVCPDGLLHKVVFAALPSQRRGYLLEDFPTVIAPIPQLLPQRKVRRPLPAENFVFVGDIMFDAARTGVRPNFPTLPESGPEIDMAAEVIRSQGGSAPITTLRGVKAGREAFLEVAARSTWLHLATHAYYLPRSDGLQAILQRPGIGVFLSPNPDGVIVTTLVPCGSAARDGRLQVGDVITRVGTATEMTSVAGKTVADVYSLLSGTRGTFVELEFTRAGNVRQTLELSRSTVKIPPAIQTSAGNLSGLSAGIALAGSDGVVTALELAQQNWQGMKLCLISACLTAEGDLTANEGVMGLHQACLIAGAESVIAASWKVDDTASRDLMERFYRNHWERGQSRLQSLRDAQLHLMKNFRFDPQTQKIIFRGPPGEARARDVQQVPLPDKSRTDRLPPWWWAGFSLYGSWQ